MACNTQPNAEHEELIDVYLTRVGWRSSRPNRLYSCLTRLVSPRHTAGSAHLQQNGPQTGHSRGGKKTERWRERTPHKETTKPPDWEAGDDWKETIERHLCEESPENWNTWSHKIRETALECRKDTRRAKNPELLALERRKEKGHSLQEHRKLSKQICRRRRHLKTQAREKTLNQGEQDDRAPPGEMGQNVGNERNHSRATRRRSQESKHGVSTPRPLSKRGGDSKR